MDVSMKNACFKWQKCTWQQQHYNVFLHCQFNTLRLVFTRTQHHVTAEVFSSSSTVPVLSCSTKEWALKRELSSTTCVAACQAVGEVLAHRCMQAGINRMVYREIPWAYRSKAVSTGPISGSSKLWHAACLCFEFFTDSVIQGGNERGRSHPQRTQKKVCRHVIFTLLFIL